eukprot:g206.t1
MNHLRNRPAPAEVVRRIKFSIRAIRDSMKHHGPLSTPELFKLCSFPGTPIPTTSYLKQYISKSKNRMGHFTKEGLAKARPVSEAEEPALKRRVGTNFVWELTEKGVEETETKAIELDPEDEALIEKYIVNRPKIGT